MTLTSINSETQKIMLAQRLCGWLFVFLCLLHFFSQRPLWLDEGFVFSNIKALNYREIFGPLEPSQVFPRLHLCIIKFFSQPFGYHVLALRIFSLATMLWAYFLWQRIYRNDLGETWESVGAMLSFSGSYAMSYYAAELKPYAMDVLAGGLVTLAILRLSRANMQSHVIHPPLWVMFLPLMLFFSYGALFFLPWPFLSLLFLSQGKRSHRSVALIYFLLSVGIFLFLYRFDLRFTSQQKALIGYWESYFLCSRSWGCFGETFWEGLRRITTWSYGFGKILMCWASFLIPFFLYGLGRYGFRGWLRAGGRIYTVPVLGAAVVSLLFVTGLMKIFPFTGERITLFLCPFVYYYVIRGIADLKRFKGVYYFFLGNYLIFLLGCVIYSIIIYVGRYQQYPTMGM
jgi:hypothetical protein